MQHLVGYYQSVDQGGAAANIAAIPDETLYAQGNDVRVPADLPFLAGAALVTAATTITAAQIRTPTLRTLAYFDISPVNNAATFNNPQAMPYMPFNPLALASQETMNFNTNTDNTGAVAIYGLAWLSDGPQSAATGEIFTVRCTAAASLSAGEWVNSNLTFSQTLPYGTYDVVGMRAESANMIGARLVFPGGRWRPGVPAVNAAGDVDINLFRFGQSGVFGTFDNNTPPTVDCLGITDTSETIFLDLIKTG